MTTITAVELRKNMADIFKKVAAGETVAVTYRGGQRFIISAEKQLKRKPMAGLDAFLAGPKRSSTLDKRKSFKELYHESLDKSREK